jgi:hypothetical protein
MFYTHSESYSFPNTSRGRILAKSIEIVMQGCGREPSVNTTSTSIEVEYSELIRIGKEDNHSNEP